MATIITGPYWPETILASSGAQGGVKAEQS
jgi:hypothetical protein